jgi:hypothetical protein
MRKHRGLLRALLLLTLQHPNGAFIRPSTELQRKTFDEVVAMILHKRCEIRHSCPDFAVRFAMLMIGFAAQATIILPRNTNVLSRFLPNVHREVQRQLRCMISRFLGADER